MTEEEFLAKVNEVAETNSLYFQGLLTAREWAGRILEISSECWDNLPKEDS